MCYPPSGYIIFNLRKLKFYGAEGREPGAVGRIWGPGVRDRITQTPLFYLLSFSAPLLLKSFYERINEMYLHLDYKS